jgi:hypothetical protein
MTISIFGYNPHFQVRGDAGREYRGEAQGRQSKWIISSKNQAIDDQFVHFLKIHSKRKIGLQEVPNRFWDFPEISWNISHGLSEAPPVVSLKGSRWCTIKGFHFGGGNFVGPFQGDLQAIQLNIFIHRGFLVVWKGGVRTAPALIP